MPPKSNSKLVTYSFPEKFHNLANVLNKQYYKPEPEVYIRGQVIVIENFLSGILCDELVKSFRGGLKLETTPLIKSKEYAMRVNDRCLIKDDQAASNLWKYLRQILVQELSYEDENIEEVKSEFEDAIGLNNSLRIYRYKQGHHFNQHYDESVKCEVFGIKGTTRWTLLIYLTGDDDFNGGGTIFYPENGREKPLNVHPKRGMALLHKHGDDCLLHEGERVSNGEKWVLRSDVVYSLSK